MGARRQKVTVSLDDKIDILDKRAVEDSPANQVFKTVRVILALVRVSAVTPLCSLWTLDSTIIQQDEVINNKDFLRLSESCFNVCEVLDTAIRGNNAEDLNESVRTALEDSERYFN